MRDGAGQGQLAQLMMETAFALRCDAHDNFPAVARVSRRLTGMIEWRRIRGAFAFLALVMIYSGVLVIARIARGHRRVRSRKTGDPGSRCRRIIVTGTFYHSGWFGSHILPLSRAAVDEIIVVCDEPQMAVPKVRYCCPPRWAARLLGRALSKTMWMVAIGSRYPADIFMGYHIFPGALSALLAASLHGKASCYQSTGGPIEVLGGGVNTENRFLSSLPGPSRHLESLALRVAGRFDCIVVRGHRAMRFFAERGRNGNVVIIPGSIDPDRFEWQDARDYDLVFVGRLTEIKQPLRFIDVIAAVRKSIPSVRAAVVGDGPLMAKTQRYAARLGVTECIDFLGERNDVERIVTRSRIVVLTSRSEGLSIAMAESMAAGAVPVVADVGELSDVVRDGENGFLVKPQCPREYADRIVSLLDDPDRWLRFARAARKAARGYCGVASVAARWDRCLRKTIVSGGAAHSGVN